MDRMTETELATEREYLRTERLGILLDTKPETLSAALIADTEADQAVEKLRGTRTEQPALL
jgi:hypothetical protein